MASATRKPTRRIGASGFAALRLGLAALLFTPALTNPGAAAQSPDVPGMVRVIIDVELTCPSCALGLERRLGRLDRVTGVEVRPADGRIVLTVESGRHVDLAAVRNTVRNAGFIPDGLAVTAAGHLTHANGAPALALSTDFAIPLAANGTAALETAAGDRLVRVTGNWHTPPDGAGRLQVESFEVR